MTGLALRFQLQSSKERKNAGKDFLLNKMKAVSVHAVRLGFIKDSSPTSLVKLRLSKISKPP